MTINLRTTEQQNIFTQAEKSHQLLKHLYKAHKNKNPKFSLQYICDRIGLPSKGYLGDVMSGRRRLSVIHAKKLALVFSLEGLEKKIFLNLVQKESERSPTKIKVLEKQIRSLKSQLTQGFSNFPQEVSQHLLFTRVFCAMGMFSESPTRQMLHQMFSPIPAAEIENIINQLIELKAISENKDKLVLSSSEVIFGINKSPAETINYIAEFIGHAKDQVKVWHSNREESYFSSSLVSVRKKDFIEKLPLIRDFFESLQTELEVPANADELVHFNVQIFPDGFKR